MKSSIIFCLLFVLINTKQEIRNTLSQITTNIPTMCQESEAVITEDQCLNTPLDYKILQCCYLKLSIDGAEEIANTATCTPMPKAVEAIKEVKDLSQFKAITKEMAGFIKYNYATEYQQIDLSVTLDLKCNNVEEMTFNVGKYTDEEKKILLSSDHCLKYTMNLMNPNIKCENGLLLDSSKQAGLECGYAAIEFKFKYGIDVPLPSFKTCTIFNLDIYQRIINSGLGEGIKDILKGSINEVLETFLPQQKELIKLIDSFRIDFYDAKGNMVSYNSTLNDYDVKPVTPPSESKSFLLNISKYLLIFSLILF
jgi:hypothetical protein